MVFSSQLISLATALAGQFDNREQALAEPVWYVHLHLWLRPVPIFTTDSLCLYAEQASIVNLDQPYRPRLWRLRDTNPIVVEHYMFQDPPAMQGAARDPDRLAAISPEAVEFLPGCTLVVSNLAEGQFRAVPESDRPCQFQYKGTTFQVALGFEVQGSQLQTYDKGIDPETGKALWGAILGPYRFQKRSDYSAEFNLAPHTGN